MIGPLLLLILVLVLLDRPGNLKAGNSQATGNVTSIQVGTATTPTLIASGSRQLTGMEAYSVDTSTVWVKVHNASSAAGVTCGTSIPVARYFVIGNTTGAGFITANDPPDLYTSGIVVCFSTTYADNTTGAPLANKFVVNFHWQ